ncbi:MAG: hypothetical protein QXM21_03340, partial [Candidatus Caldarchaeum sp.]
FRIPNMYKPLFYLEAKDGREVRISLWVEDDTPCFSYEEHGEPPFVPSGSEPNYHGGNGIEVNAVKHLKTGIIALTATEY